MKNQLARTVLVTLASLLGLWLVRNLALYAWGENGKLSEFGNLAFSLLINIYTGFLALYLATGRWLPVRNEGVATGASSVQAGGPGVNPSAALVVVAVAWLGIYFLADLFVQSAASGLFNPTVLGVHLLENDAMRIGTMFAGLIYVAMLFPLMAGSSLLCGWACRSTFSFRSGWLPATLFVLVAFASNYGQEVLETGRPPSIAMTQMIFRLPEQNLILADLLVMWLVTMVFLVLVTSGLSIYFFIWARLGRAFRRFV
jgi:hypothetical protein